MNLFEVKQMLEVETALSIKVQDDSVLIEEEVLHVVFSAGVCYVIPTNTRIHSIIHFDGIQAKFEHNMRYIRFDFYKSGLLTGSVLIPRKKE